MHFSLFRCWAVMDGAAASLLYKQGSLVRAGTAHHQKAPLKRGFLSPDSGRRTPNMANECVKRARRPLGASLNEQGQFARRNTN
jgi:hypothetical protein